MKNRIIYFSLFLILTSFVNIPVSATENIEKSPLESNLNTNSKGVNNSSDLVGKLKERKSANVTSGDVLQLVEDMLNTVQIGLAVFSVILTLLISGVGVWFIKSQESLKKELKQAQKKFDSQYQKSKKFSLKAEEQYRSQLEEVEYISSKAKAKLKETKLHLKSLDETDVLTKTKISAIQQTLIFCLEKAPDRDIAFSTYSKLLSAYEILLNNSHETIPRQLQEEMEMAATLVSGNKQYVPDEIIRFMIESMNLPYEVRGILWGKV